MAISPRWPDTRSRTPVNGHSDRLPIRPHLVRLKLLAMMSAMALVGAGLADTVLLRVPVGDGSGEFVEIQVARADLEGANESGVVLAADNGSRFEATGFSLASAMDRVLPALRVILGRLRSGEFSPDEVTMELGLQIGGETGVFFARGTAEASVAVTMTWHRHPKGAGLEADEQPRVPADKAREPSAGTDAAG